MRSAIAAEGTKSSPAVVLGVLATIDAITLNEWVAAATLIYIGIQAGYLTWKWIKEYRAGGH